MKKLLMIMLFCIIPRMQITGREVLASDGGDIGPPGPNEVHIGPNALVMPLGKIVLVRRGSEYCAVKFTEAWAGKTVEDQYAKYESYYQDDGTGDFFNKNVQFRKDQLCDRRFIGFMRFGFRAGFENLEMKCGPIRLFWSAEGSVHFRGLGQKDGDYGIELAPTQWTDISQVNVFDPRLKWYRYDEKRRRINILIDQLWEDKEEEKR